MKSVVVFVAQIDRSSKGPILFLIFPLYEYDEGQFLGRKDK